jgi:hypothetical protein
LQHVLQTCAAAGHSLFWPLARMAKQQKGGTVELAGKR